MHIGCVWWGSFTLELIKEQLRALFDSFSPQPVASMNHFGIENAKSALKAGRNTYFFKSHAPVRC